MGGTYTLEGTQGSIHTETYMRWEYARHTYGVGLHMKGHTHGGDIHMDWAYTCTECMDI